ncbi:MAG: hypothetical protein ACD_3C00216G0009 [uncultured bacterium (gcode 4)]|uniref:PKD domain-containing protein n=1 Tax=uncultured bacterium (gcode 4) TaxID=1234023 RepID=K2F877_9BACT|nr:MAG: hypothetical protein ACD_3C00216G0009 [uncultured bacterium (gcode 4)]
MITNIFFKKILLIIFLSLFIAWASAETIVNFPFVDIKPSDELYKDLKTLYSNNVVKDTPDHQFHPDSLITRDEFLWIVVWVWCKDCINPTIDDFIKYDLSPFVDLSKFNPYYYCIANWKESSITQWYLLDSKWEYTCQNKKTFTSTPFCPENNITRIEATAMLLRIAKVWDDNLNSKVVKDVVIKDVDDQWYWFAKKWIEIWILKKDKEDKVYPNEYLKRREFVHMSTKVFWINFCEIKNAKAKEWLSSDIKIFDKNNSDSSSWKWTETTFPNQKETVYDFNAYSENKWDFEYSWKFTNTTTKEVLNASWKFLDNFDLKTDWKWIIEMNIKDKGTWEISESFSQISVSKEGNDKNTSSISSDITATPIFWEWPLSVIFDSTITWWKWGIIQLWDFWDWQTSSKTEVTHTYTEPWVYTVTLKVIDELWNTWLSQITIEVAETVDTDNDWVKDKLDKCPQIFWLSAYGWCPFIEEYKKPWTIGSNNGNNSGVKNNEEVSAEIKIFDKTNPQSAKWIWNLSQFTNQKEKIYDFYAHTETAGNFDYKWEFTNTTTKEVINASWKFLDDYDLKTNWVWIAKLIIKDKDTGKEAISTTQISVTDKPTSWTSSDNSNKLIVNIDSNLLVGKTPIDIDLKSIVEGANWDVQYKWNFWDWQTSDLPNPSHAYQIGWAYTITLTATDSKWNTWKAQIVIVANWNDILSLIKKDDSSIGNLCISEKSKGKWTIEWLLACNSCPCSFSLNYLASVKSCDIIFPAISSPDKKTLYSRWSIYQIK